MNWGIIGCANIAKTAIIPAINDSSQDKLIAVSSRTKDKADAFALDFDCKSYYSYDAILEDSDINIVYIPLPTGLHYEWVIKALNAGKHVLVEKSASTTLLQAQEMVDLARSKNLALVENFQFQYHSQHQYVKELVRNGTIGEVRCFRSTFGFPPFSVDSNIRYNKELGGGALLDAGAYTLRATSFILGNDFEVKSSFLSLNSDFNVDWFGGAFLVDSKNGVFSEVAFGFDNFYQCSYEIWGSKGKITATRAYTAKPNFSPTLILETVNGTEHKILDPDNHFANMISNINVIISEQEYEDDYEKITYQASLIEQVRMAANK